ncbi:MAG: hypothetical protein O3A47_05110 [Chloroflexi bacterium]|nr:hypothetical protein [Chloroflexota bacterium]
MEKIAGITEIHVPLSGEFITGEQSGKLRGPCRAAHVDQQGRVVHVGLVFNGKAQLLGNIQSEVTRAQAVAQGLTPAEVASQAEDS